jgi:hypothetical protein
MYRRFLTFLLLPTLLLTQWVNGSRCLGRCEAAGHDNRPHIHLTSTLTGSPDAKKCGCQRQQKAEEASSGLSSCIVVRSPSKAVEQPQIPAPNDDILYLSFDTFLGLPTSAVGIADVVSDVGSQSACFDALPHRICDSTINRFSPCVTPPPYARCPLYVRVCSLLI